MLVLVMSLLYWTQTEGGCSGTIVSISGDVRMLPVGKCFQLRCEFTCLRAQDVAQLCRRRGDEEPVCLVNVTSILPNVSLVLDISPATKAHTGNYSCRTQPPFAISPSVSIQITDKIPKELTPTTSSPHQPSSPAGLQGQLWCWMLLGKTAVLFLSLASLAVKCKRG